MLEQNKIISNVLFHYFSKFASTMIIINYQINIIIAEIVIFRVKKSFRIFLFLKNDFDE